MTSYEFFELQLFYDYYKIAWHTEQKRLWIAFYHKHKLAKLEEPDKETASQMGEDELMAIHKMINSITTDTLIRKTGYIET